MKLRNENFKWCTFYASFKYQMMLVLQCKRFWATPPSIDSSSPWGIISLIENPKTIDD